MLLSNLLHALLRNPWQTARKRRVRRLIEQGEVLLKRSDWKTALRALSRALAQESRNARVHYLIASAHVQAGSYELAQEHLECSASLDASSVETHIRLANVYQVRGELARAEESYLRALALDADARLAHYNYGLLLRQQRRSREALTHLRSAHAAAALEGQMLRPLVLALLDCEEHGEAARIAEEAARTQPECYDALCCLGLAYQKLHRPQEALASYDRALRLRPDDAELYSNRAVALQDLARWPEALAEYEKALALKPDYELARFHRALARLATGNYEAAWPDYEARLLTIDVPRRACAYPRWDGDRTPGGTVLVYGEQGLGDEIMFASCIPDLAGTARHCIIECAPKLRPLFERSFPAATVYAATEDRCVPDAVRAQGIDFEVPSGSLPRYYRGSIDDFLRHGGYLRAAPERVAAWKARLDERGGGLKVGLSWRGGTHQTRSPLRSIDLDGLLPILRVPGVRFVSLQYSPEAPAELAALMREHGIDVIHSTEAIADYDETAALVSALDLTITVCTAIVHLAGALGRPVWVLAPHSPEWRYGAAGESMAWYPSARVFRQPARGAWTPVIAAVAARLSEYRPQC